ncbi:MAG: C1 family peptidase [Clostridia bacterium]|nr:C1 family peptidase [Clostridia bacterium]
MKEITPEFVRAQTEAFLADPQARAMANAVSRAGALPPAIDQELQKQLPFIFGIDVWDEGVTDQGSTGRCWAFASLNVVRQNMKRTLRIAEKNFELSQNYIYFFDQLEKSAAFLDRFLQRIDEPLASPATQNLLRRPIQDNGMWYTFMALAGKYGVVPKSAMPDTQCSRDSKYVTRLLEQKLKLSAKQLWDLRQQGGDEDALLALREQQLGGVFSILTRFLGAPPQTVAFEYRRDDGASVRLPAMTPLAFFEAYGGMRAEDYMLILNCPLEEYPFMQCYTTEKGCESVLDRRLNLDADTIRQLVIASLRGGDQVIMGCDVSKQSDKPSGYMHRRLLDYETVFGTTLEFPDKASWLRFKGQSGSTSGSHIMTFSGVQLDEAGRPLRWKVHNSYGPGMGIRGHYVMDDSWFDMFVTSVVIARKYAPPEVLAAFDGEVLPMDGSVLF